MLKQHLCILLAVFMVLCCTGCGRETVPAPTEESTLAFEPTTEPTQIPTEPVTEPASEPTGAPLLLHSGLREDGTFSEGTLFLGDSLTYAFVGNYLAENSLLGDAKYATQCGSQVTAFFGTNVLANNNEMMTRYSEAFEGMEFDEAAASLGESAAAIYIMWGTNYTPDATAETYIQIVDYLLENCPNATIHLQLIPYGDPSIVACDTVNTRIRGAYAHYQQTGEERVFLIDTYTAIGRHTVDGVHLDTTGYGSWYQAIVDHAEANGLSQ